jgi:hypothetical protein
MIRIESSCSAVFAEANDVMQARFTCSLVALLFRRPKVAPPACGRDRLRPVTLGDRLAAIRRHVRCSAPPKAEAPLMGCQKDRKAPLFSLVLKCRSGAHSRVVAARRPKPFCRTPRAIHVGRYRYRH